MDVWWIRKIRIGMNYTMRPNIIASEFVFKCIMTGVFILFIVVTIPLFSESPSLSIIIHICLLIGLVIFVRSILWDIIGKEILTITEHELVIERILLLSKRSIVIMLEDVISVNCTQYTKKTDNGIFFNSITFWRYLASITSLNKGYVVVQTFYRSYNFVWISGKESLLLAE